MLKLTAIRAHTDPRNVVRDFTAGSQAPVTSGCPFPRAIMHLANTRTAFTDQPGFRALSVAGLDPV